LKTITFKAPKRNLWCKTETNV